MLKIGRENAHRNQSGLSGGKESLRGFFCYIDHYGQDLRLWQLLDRMEISYHGNILSKMWSQDAHYAKALDRREEGYAIDTTDLDTLIDSIADLNSRMPMIKSIRGPYDAPHMWLQDTLALAKLHKADFIVYNGTPGCRNTWGMVKPFARDTEKNGFPHPHPLLRRLRYAGGIVGDDGLQDRGISESKEIAHMITAGCDVGSLTSKAVIMKDNRIVAQEVIRSRTKPAESAVAVMDCALQKAGMTLADINFCVGTGYGRDRIPFVQEAVSEISCHARGARWLLPTVKTVIDIGGQDCKAMRIDKDGKIVKFITNDKCASGTGRFLEVMARLINVSLDDLGELSARAKAPITMANACTVWAQADVIQHLNDGVAAEDIGAGINNAMASRMAVLANNIGLERDLCMTGGVAKNAGVVTALEKLLGMTIKRIKKVDPQLVGAVGAALIAGDKMERRGAS